MAAVDTFFVYDWKTVCVFSPKNKILTKGTGKIWSTFSVGSSRHRVGLHRAGTSVRSCRVQASGER